ncbi:MAG: PIG-L family deacetylase [Proteobacteria bacterium]|nr:PIG-L family deacetylase [Pseudomonadota bacterium]
MLQIAAPAIILDFMNVSERLAENIMQGMRLVCCAALFVGALQTVPALANDNAKPYKVSFYFAAHQDDWQLFMNPSAFEDVISAAAKTVFIYTTAGDAGLGIGTGGRKHPYFLARENGAETAVRFMADADDAPDSRSASHMSFNGHPIYRVAYRNTVSYFLRLPDGNLDGSGYYDTGFQSLRRLANNDIAAVAAVDGSTVYHGWRDLTATLRGIITFERGNLTLAQINIAEVDQRRNPNDHSDHQMTAKAALDAANHLPCVRRVYYIDYASARLPENLNSQQRDRESSVFAVTLAGVLALDHRTSWHHYDKAYVGRNYFRVEEPSGRCGEAETRISAVRH